MASESEPTYVGVPFWSKTTRRDFLSEPNLTIVVKKLLPTLS